MRLTRAHHFLAVAVSTLPLQLASCQNYLLVAKPKCNESVIGGFTHPGIFHSCEDLTRAQTKVWPGEEPWATAFGRMFNQSLFALNTVATNSYNIRGPLPALPYGQDAWSSNFTVDSQYAYLNAVAYFITGHPFHRERVLHTARRWLTELNILEEYIRGGNGLRYLTAACEIMRSITTSWWTENDTKLYHDFADRVRRNWDDTNGMARPDLYFNQGAYANGGALSMAIFLGDLDLYQQIIQQVTVGRNPDPTIDYAISMQIRNETKYKGQVAEMGRDQGHPAGMLNIVSSMAYSVEIQGDIDGQIQFVDLFEYDDYRFLDGMEYVMVIGSRCLRHLTTEYFAAFNLGHDVAYKTLRIGFDSEEYWNQSARTPDRGKIYRTTQHPTDIGALNVPIAAYYRYKELLPDRIKYLKTYVESQTLGFDSLLYMREGNYEDLDFIWDNGYGASYMDVISGPGARRRFSTLNETVEAHSRNSTFADIAVVKGNTNISYPLFSPVKTTPFLRFEAKSTDGSEIKITNQFGETISQHKVPPSDRFQTQYLNTTLEEEADDGFFYLFTSNDVEIARFNMTEATEVVDPFTNPN